jgi:hypothetical protein
MTDQATALGLYRCPGNPPFHVSRRLPEVVHQDTYLTAKHKPDFDALPWEAIGQLTRRHRCDDAQPPAPST